MEFNHYAYIFLSPGMDENKNRSVMKSDQATCVIVGLDPKNKSRVVDIAKELIADGAQMIELCGGFGSVWMAKIIEATNGAVPIGGVFYGPEARKKLVDLGLGGS
jgi:hypothetical protein